MLAKKMLVLGIMALVLSAGCVKKAQIEQSEVAKRKILVMVNGEPTCFVWNLAGSMVSAAAFGMVGTLGNMVASDVRGDKFEAALKDFPLNARIRDALVTELRAGLKQEIVPVCQPGEDPAGGCVKIVDLESLRKDQPGTLLLAVKPCEYGLRDDKPYLALNVGFFETDSQNAVWRYQAVLPADEIPEKQKLQYWTEHPTELVASLEAQITKMAKIISGYVAVGKAPEAKPAWVYAGCAPLTSKSCMPDKP